ncbi:MAG: hypothetical protein D6785_16265, partial [Planctomycetota bacterium]
FIFRLLGEIIVKNKGRIIFLFLLLSLIPLYSLKKLEIRTDYADLLSQDEPYQKEFNKYIQNFGASEALYALIISPKATQIADKAYQKLVDLRGPQKQKLVKMVRYRISPKFLETFGLLLAPPRDFAKIKSQLMENKDFIQGLLKARNLAEVFQNIGTSLNKQSKNLDSLMKVHHPEEARFLKELLLGLKKACTHGEINLPVFFKIDENNQENPYHVNSQGYFVLASRSKQKNVLMQIFPTVTSDDYEPLKLFLGEVEKVFQKIIEKEGGKVFFSGSPKLTVDEGEDSNRDMKTLSLIAVIGVGFIFMFFFGRILWPLLAIFVLGFAILWTFGAAVFLFGYLNIISTVFAVVLVGLGIDFGIHFIERFGEFFCFQSTLSPNEATKEALLRSGLAITTSALTTAAAFFISAFSGFQGSFQLGILAGLGILICLAFMMILLPAIILKVEHLYPFTKQDIEECSHSYIMEWIDRATNQKILILSLSLILGIYGIYGFFEVPFDSNLLNLQKETSEAVKLEKELMEEHNLSFRFALILKEKWTLPELEKLVKRIKTLSTVHPNRIESILTLIPPWRIKRRKEIKDLAQEILPSQKDSASLPLRQEDLAQSLESFAEICDELASKSLQSQKKEWASFFEALATLSEDLVDLLQKPLPKNKWQRVLKYQNQILDQVKILQKLLSPPPLDLKTLPAELKDYFIAPSGMTAIYIYPKVNVRKPENLEAFVKELRSISPSVTGPTVQTFEVTIQMKEGYKKAGILALLAVYMILLWEFKSFKIAFLAILPLILGALIMVGAMTFWQIPFNPANLMALPLLFGVGVDNTIHILHRYFSEGEKNISKILRFTGKAILVTSLTTGIGFGCLALGPVLNSIGSLLGWDHIVAGHRGLSSLGIVMTLGVLSCLYTSLFFLPALLKVKNSNIQTEGEKDSE